MQSDLRFCWVCSWRRIDSLVRSLACSNEDTKGHISSALIDLAISSSSLPTSITIASYPRLTDMLLKSSSMKLNHRKMNRHWHALIGSICMCLICPPIPWVHVKLKGYVLNNFANYGKLEVTERIDFSMTWVLSEAPFLENLQLNSSYIFV